MKGMIGIRTATCGAFNQQAQTLLLSYGLLCLVVHRIHPLIELLRVQHPPLIDLPRACRLTATSVPEADSVPCAR